MSIKLFCLEKGKTPAVQHAFPVNISRDETVGDLKDVIKAKKAPYFNDFPADHLKLWFANIPADLDDQINSLPWPNSIQLLPIKKVSYYFSNDNEPLDEHIHVIIEVPAGN